MINLHVIVKILISLSLKISLPVSFAYQDMDVLMGKKLVLKNCQSYKAQYYLRKKKIVLYYFSASWVDDVELLRKLKVLYFENMQRNIGIEIIFVSCDNDEKKFSKNFRDHHGPWPGVSPDNKALFQELVYLYNITCLPQMIVVRKEDGFIITRRGKEEFEKSGINVLVTWSDYDPNLTLIDDNLFDLKNEAIPDGTPEKPPENVEERSNQPKEGDAVSLEPGQNKALSFASNRQETGSGKK